MPTTAQIYKVFISSPSDVQEERKAVEEVISLWNAANHARGIMLYGVPYEKHLVPKQGEPQLDINKLVEQCDILVAIFGARIGTETARAISASVEEVELAIENGIHAMVYFSNAPLPRDVDLSQIQKLRDFMAKYQSMGYYQTYNDVPHFRELLRHQLDLLMNTLLSGTGEIPPNNELIQRIWKLFQQYETMLVYCRKRGSTYTKDSYFLTEILEELHNIKVGVVEAGLDDLLETIDSACVTTEAAKRITIMMDGGISLNQFWGYLDKVESLLRELSSKVGQAVYEYNNGDVAAEIRKIGISLESKLKTKREVRAGYKETKDELENALFNLIRLKSLLPSYSATVSASFADAVDKLADAMESRETLGIERFHEFIDKSVTACEAIKGLPEILQQNG